MTICISADWLTDLTKNVRQSAWPLVNRLKNVWPADYLMDRPTETRWLTNWLTKYHRKNLAENFLVLYLTDWLTTWHFWVTKKLTVSPRIKEYHDEKISKDEWFRCLCHRNDMREKIVIVKSRRKFSKAQGKVACKFDDTALISVYWGLLFWAPVFLLCVVLYAGYITGKN